MTLRIGVVGLGVGEQHVNAFQAHPACRVITVADPDPAKLAMAAAKWPGVKCESRPEVVLEDPAIDLVCIASPDDAHFTQVVRALGAGKHVFAEKPLCLFEEQTRAIWDLLAASPRLRLSSNTVLRRSPRFLDLRGRIRRGELGRIFMLDADYNYGRLWKITEGWRGKIADYSVMLGGGIHMIDLAMWLTGRKVTEVHAYGSGISTEGSAFSGHDTVAAIAKFDDGSVARFAANFGCVEPHFHRLTVYGTAATFENARGAALLRRSRDPLDQAEQIPTAYPAVPKGALIPSFVDAILGEGNPDVDENDVFDAMAVCHAVDRALSNGQPARVEYFGRIDRTKNHA